MLGNWSFGDDDYFKREASMALGLLTKVWRLPKEPPVGHSVRRGRRADCRR
ncbi:MAG: hypothetical protein R3F17_09700 [Planctomycetota bacterium]